MATYEGKWRCTYCGAVSRGRDMDCTGCGARRGADVEFFLEDDAPALTDEALLAEAGGGPDWICETCGGSNRAACQTCQTCGAPVGDSASRPVVEGPPGSFREPDKDAAPSPNQPPPRFPYTKDPPAGRARARALATATAFNRPSWTVIIVLAAFVVLLAVFAVYLNGGSAGRSFAPHVDPRHSITRDIELEVEGVRWARAVGVEEYRQVTLEAWEDAVPPDARVVSRRREVHHHDRVKVGSHVVPEHYTERVRVGSHTETEYYTEREQDGTESYKCGTRNKGNGYFEDVYCTRPVYRNVTKSRSRRVDDYQTVTRTRDKVVEDFEDVPVYRTKVEYTVKRWMPADTAEARGTDLKPFWPQVTTGPTRREGRRTESYVVLLRDVQSGRTYERAVGPEEFALYAPGVRCAARVNGFDQIIALTPPPRKETPDGDKTAAGEADKE